MTDVWHNGRFVDAAGAIAANDRGLLLADGVFDTALVLGGRVFRLEAHVDRLVAACRTLEIPVARADLDAAVAALAGRHGSGSIRLTVTRGPGPRGLSCPPQPQPTILGSSAPLAPAAMFAPLTLFETAIRRNETSPLSRLKSLAYLDAVLANRDARKAGADEALFANGAGRPVCTALGNLFLLDGDALITPPLEEGVLDGIIRGWILGHAGLFGLSAREEPVSRERLAAGPLFVTNSLRLIAPACLVGRPRPADDRRVAALMQGLCAALAAECGTDPREHGARLPA
ncbi:aminotransferase class IV [Jiella sp. M17.18]|uniref:aminotransferase class IV n=1 Tax=Jiella sp. M17.18 TaxID=3234247 RepID=UPI0034E0156D